MKSQNEGFNKASINSGAHCVRENEYAGACGASGAVVWSLSADKTLLTVSGAGAMDNYSPPCFAPWQDSISLIEKIEVKSGVTSVGDYAFQGACKLTSAALAESVELLGVYSFSGCSDMTELSLPEGLTVIEAKAFSNCGSLQTVRLPSTLTNIDMKAFHGSDCVSDVYFAGSPSQWNNVNVSRAASGNTSLTGASFHFGKSDSCSPTLSAVAEPNRYDQIIATARVALNNHGDGRLHVLTPDLTTPGLRGKTGDCALIIFPNGKTMMIDAGHPGCSHHIISLIKALGLTNLDTFMVSHPHLDHVGGAMDVMEYLYEAGGSVHNYYTNIRQHFKVIEPSLREFLRGKGVTVRFCSAGDKWTVGETEVEIFCPETEVPLVPENDTEDMNNLSIVMKLTYGKSSYLTCGDLYIDKERRLVEKYGASLQADVLKANHHGVYTSNSPLWIETVSPKYVIAPAEDIGRTVFSRRLAAAGISYYSAGLDGLTLISMNDGASYQVLSQRDSSLRERLMQK